MPQKSVFSERKSISRDLMRTSFCWELCLSPWCPWCLPLPHPNWPLAPHFLASCLASVLGAFTSLPLALGTLALIFKLHPVPRCAPCPGVKAPALPGCQEQGRCHRARGQANGKTAMAFPTNRDYLEPPQIKCHWVWWWFSGFLFGVCEFRGVAAWEELAERLGVVKRER